MKEEKEIRETITRLEVIRSNAYLIKENLVASSITTIIETLKWVLEEKEEKEVL
jgi:uncharacterized protein YeeX (DUF496 family)